MRKYSGGEIDPGSSGSPSTSQGQSYESAAPPSETPQPPASESSDTEYFDYRKEFPDLRPPGSYVPTEPLGMQDDPTEQEYSRFSPWNHLEYRVFGEPSDFIRHEKEISEFALDGSYVDSGPKYTISYILPPGCFDYSVLRFDAGFKYDAIKFGELPSHYAKIPPGADPFGMKEGNFDRGNLTSCWENKHDEIITRENVPGGIYETERFIRGISQMQEDMHVITYYIKLEDDKLMYLFFYVSTDANAEDLLLYDAMANSVEIIA